MIKDFNSWYLADYSTDSSTPTRALKRVRIKKNYWKQCQGSMAARGMQSNPGKLFQFANNKYTSTTTHASFWDVTQINNFKKAIVTGNEASIESQGDKRGFMQISSSSSVPWVVKYSNMKVGGKIKHNSTYYAPDSQDEDEFLVDVSATLTNVAHAFSFVYEKEDGTTASANRWQEGDYAPENIATYPTVPAVVNPTAYSIVS